GGGGKTVSVRVKGVYRALDATTPGPYWAHFLRKIFPPGVDPPPPVRYVLTTRGQFRGLVGSLSTHRTSGPPVATMAELAVDPRNLTIARARTLSHSFARLRSQLRGSAFGKALGCTGPAPGPAPFLQIGTGTPPHCRVASSLSSAVVIADRNVSEISP